MSVHEKTNNDAELDQFEAEPVIDNEGDRFVTQDFFERLQGLGATGLRPRLTV